MCIYERIYVSSYIYIWLSLTHTHTDTHSLVHGRASINVSTVNMLFLAAQQIHVGGMNNSQIFFRPGYK